MDSRTSTSRFKLLYCRFRAAHPAGAERIDLFSIEITLRYKRQNQLRSFAVPNRKPNQTMVIRVKVPC